MVTRAFFQFGGWESRAEVLATPPFSTLAIAVVEPETDTRFRVGGCGARNVAGPRDPSLASDSCFKMFGPHLVDPVEGNPK